MLLFGLLIAVFNYAVNQPTTKVDTAWPPESEIVSSAPVMPTVVNLITLYDRFPNDVQMVYVAKYGDPNIFMTASDHIVVWYMIDANGFAVKHTGDLYVLSDQHERSVEGCTFKLTK